MAESETLVDEDTATEVETTEVVTTAEGEATEVVDAVEVDSAAGENMDTLGAEITLILETKSEAKSTRSHKSLKGTIAGSLRRFSMGSKVSGLNWKGSQYSVNTRTTDDYMDPVQRRSRKTIGKVVVREEHTEWIKEEILSDFRDTKVQLANLTYFPDDHPEFPGQPFSNMMDQMWIEMSLMSEHIDGINDRLERLGVSPTPDPPTPPPRYPTPNIFQSFFCWHRYQIDSDEEDRPEQPPQEPEKKEDEKKEDEEVREMEDSLPKSPGCCQ